MTDADKVKNIIAFLFLIFQKVGNEFASFNNIIHSIMHFSPEYLIEKYERYIKVMKECDGEGLHPITKEVLFEKYCEKWKIDHQCSSKLRQCVYESDGLLWKRFFDDAKKYYLHCQRCEAFYNEVNEHE